VRNDVIAERSLLWSLNRATSAPTNPHNQTIEAGHVLENKL